MDAKRLFKKAVNLLTLSSFLLWNLAVAAPEGGAVAGGSATITQSGTTTTINQSSQNTVINWQGFNTAQNETVRFNQPGPSAIALNRINSGLPTTFNGTLSANGQVWIVNPNGIVFGVGSQINVAGLVATTHGIVDADFMAGHYQFTLDPNFINSQVINNGTITIADNGIAALVGPTVANNGTIIANFGKVALSTGSAFVLDLYGDNLINFGTSAPSAKGSVSNSGLIQATGGKVYMTANTAAGILDNVISMSGTIEATTASTGQHGSIILNGGHAGRVKVSGKLDASNGGKIETSGYVLDLDPAAVINAGAGGSWLLDPFDITVVAGLTCTGAPGCPPFAPLSATSFIGADTITGQLNAGTSVTLDTGVPGGDAGNISVNAAIVQTVDAGPVTLTFNAANQFAWNATISLQPTASLVVNAGSVTASVLATMTNATITTTGTQTYTTVNVTGNNSLIAGSDITFNSTIDGPGALSVVTSGSIFFNDPLIGTGTPLSSLSAAASGLIWVLTNNFVPAEIITTGNQTYGDATHGGDLTIDLFNNPAINFQGSQVEFKTSLDFGEIADVTITGNMLLDVGRNIGVSDVIVRSVTVTGSSDIGGQIDTSTGDQTFVGPVVFHGTAAFNPQDGGSVIFDSTIDGPGNAQIISAFGSVFFNDNIGVGTVLGFLDVNGFNGEIDIKNPTNTMTIRTTGPQNYESAAIGILLDTLNSITFDAPGQNVGFFGQMDSFNSAAAPLSTTVVVNGNLIYGAGGIGQNYNVSSNYTDVTSLDVKGTSFIGIGADVNIRTLNFQLYENDVALGGNNQNLTAVNGASGTITFQGVLDGSSFDTQNIVVNASGIATFNGAIGDPNDRIASLSITGSQIILNTPQVITAGNQDYFGPVTLQQDMLAPGGFQTQLNNQSITFHGTLDGAFSVDINRFNGAAGTVTFDGEVGFGSALNTLDVTATQININTDIIDTSADQAYRGPVVLMASVSAIGPNGMMAGGGVTFYSTLDGDGNGPWDLVILATGGVNFNASVGSNNGLNTLDVTGSQINLNPLDIANFQINTVVSLATGQDYRSPVFVTGTVTLQQVNDFSADVIFESTVDGPGSLIINPIATATSPGNVEFDNAVGAGTLLSSIDVAGSLIIFNGAQTIQTSGDQHYRGPVLLDNDVDSPGLISTTGNITFDSTIDSDFKLGNMNLTINAAGDVVFSGSIGVDSAGSELNNLIVTGSTITTNNNMKFITTVGDQTYNATLMTINADPIITGANITENTPVVLNFDTTYISSGWTWFQNTVDGPASLTVQATGFVQFDGVVGGTPLASLDVTSGTGVGQAININTSSITTSGAQNYNTLVMLGVDTIITSNGGTVVFNSTVDGSQNLVVTALNGGIGLNDAVGGSIPLQSLNFTSMFVVSLGAVSAVSTVFDQIYNAPFVLVNPPIGIFTETDPGSAVIFNIGLVTTILGTPITINGNAEFRGIFYPVVVPLQELGAIVVTGTTLLDGVTVQSFSQDYKGGVTVTANNATNGSEGLIQFESTVDGPGSLTINPASLITSPGTTTFAGDVGATTHLASLMVTGTSLFNKGSSQFVYTNGNQIYSDTVTINNDVSMKTFVDGDIQLNGGGAKDPGLTLSLYSSDAALGPVGHGITGKVSVANLILGGPGGANLSETFQTGGGAAVESFVGSPLAGAQQARINTIAPPNVDGVVIYCVNGYFCTPAPIPPTPPVPPAAAPLFDVAPTEIFNTPVESVCDASGCTNLDLINEDFVESGVVSCAGNGCPYGFIEAHDMNGRTRILMQGDVVYVGDTLYKDKNSCVCVKGVSGKRACYGPGQTKVVYDK